MVLQNNTLSKTVLNLFVDETVSWRLNRSDLAIVFEKLIFIRLRIHNSALYKDTVYCFRNLLFSRVCLSLIINALACAFKI